MTDEKETKLFIPCGCAGNCTVLAVDRWKFDGDSEWWFEVYTRAHERAPLRWRIKQALKIAFNRNPYIDALCFNDSEIEALRRFIDSHIPPNITYTTTTTNWSAPRDGS